MCGSAKKALACAAAVACVLPCELLLSVTTAGSWRAVVCLECVARNIRAASLALVWFYDFHLKIRSVLKILLSVLNL